VQEERAAKPAEKRAAEALLAGAPRDLPEIEEGGESEIEIDASATVSEEERLRSLDFELMSNAEMAEAKRMLAHRAARWPIRAGGRWTGGAACARRCAGGARCGRRR